MRITLKVPELELEANKVDTPTGAAWSVKMPGERKVLINFFHGKWDTTDDISDPLVQAIGNKINQFLEADLPEIPNDRNPLHNPRPKRARIPKYFLAQPFLPFS